MEGNPKLLPLRIRRDIRDDFEREDGEVGRRTKDFSSNLGPTVTFTVNWLGLWTALQSDTLGQDTFVRNVEQLAVAFCDVCLEFIAQPDNDDLFEGFLSDLSGKHELIINIIPDVDSVDDLPHATWQPTGAQITLAVPPHIDDCPLARISNTLRDDLLTILSRRNQGLDTSEPLHSSAPRPYLPPPPAVPSETPAVPQRLPRLDAIPRPEEILGGPPYLLTIDQTSRAHIYVQCSHSDTLVLLEEYLKKWTRRNHNFVGENQMIKTRLIESPFGISRSYEALIIEANRAESVSALSILCFVETALGFRPTGLVAAGSRWQFRRAEAFE